MGAIVNQIIVTCPTCPLRVTHLSWTSHHCHDWYQELQLVGLGKGCTHLIPEHQPDQPQLPRSIYCRQNSFMWDNIYFDTYETWEHVRSREVKIFPLGSRNKLPTHWQRRSCQTPSFNTARPCLDSNPRCFSKGVWGKLYYSTYGTPVLKSRLCLQSKPSTEYSCNSSQKIQAIISWHNQRPVICRRGCRSIQDPNSHFNDNTTEYSNDIPNVKSLSTQCFWWIFNWRIQSSNCSELLPLTISVQYSDGSCFFSNSNKILGAIVFSVQIASSQFFARYPFWDFTWFKLDLPSLFSQRILVNLELSCT